MYYNFEKLVFKNIVRVLKEHRYFLIFMRAISCGTVNLYSMMLPSHIIRDNFLTNCSDLEDIYNRMYFSLRDRKWRGVELSKQHIKEQQILITRYVNTLLHECIEPYVNENVNMETIGQECFDSCCQELFGKDFVDLTEITEHRNNLDEFASWFDLQISDYSHN